MISRILAVCDLPVDFPEKLRILRAMFIPRSNLTNLKPAFVAAVWSRRMSPAENGPMLSVHHCPAGGDPGFHVVWSRCGMVRRVFFLLINLVKQSGSVVCCIMFLSGLRDMSRLIYLLKVGAPLSSVGTLIFDGFMAGGIRLLRDFVVEVVFDKKLLDSAHVRERDKAPFRSIFDSKSLE